MNLIGSAKLGKVNYETDVTSDPVTQAIDGFHFFTRDDIKAQTGYDSQELFDAYVYMYASNFGMLNHLGKHAPIHLNDVASLSAFRKRQSGHKLKPKAMIVTLNHDSEDLGKELAEGNQTYALPATYVVIDAAHYILSKRAGVDINTLVHLLTDKADMIFDPARDYFMSKAKAKPGVKSILSSDDVNAKLDELYQEFPISQTTVNEFYIELIKRWQSVLGLLSLDDHKAYLPIKERDYWSDTISSFIGKLVEKVKAEDVQDARDLKTIVRQEYEKVRDVISKPSELLHVPSKLIFDLEPELIPRIEQTLYQKLYAQPLMDASMAYATADEDPGLIKLLDARDNSARLGPKIENMRNQTLKYSGLLRDAADAISKRKASALPYKIMERYMIFLYNTLKDAVETRRDHFGEYNEDQTQYKKDYDRLVFMAGLMPALGEKIGVKSHNLGSILKRASRLGSFF